MSEPVKLPSLRNPVMIATFEGWNDAGNAATGAMEHLLDVWQPEPILAVDPEKYHDFQVNRPETTLDEEGNRRIIWHTTRLSWARPPGSERDVVLVRGVEPSFAWRSFVGELLEYATRLQVRTLVTLGALVSDIPHTRPIPVSTTSDDPELLARLMIRPSHYEGPTGIVGVLQDTASRRGLPGLSLWAAIPNYVAHPPSPKAVLALVTRVEELLRVSIDLQDLAEEAEAWENGVDELASEDAEIAEYVRQLERSKDTSELPEATGEAIAREFERYLRRRRDEPPKP